MKVLRNNKDSVMAMLEAFVHDPLINWRLLNTTDTVPETATSRDTDGKELGQIKSCGIKKTGGRSRRVGGHVLLYSFRYLWVLNACIYPLPGLFCTLLFIKDQFSDFADGDCLSLVRSSV